jgi:hypothetical protein
VNGDPKLRARLERLASNAGDPPERGLDRVAARRHRRLRRRRGAVVTAAALAVLLGGVSLVVDGGPEAEHVAVSPARRPTAAAQLPATVEVHCTPTGTGITIRVASVRPQQDGMHVRVFNDLTTPTEVRVIKEDEWAGRQQFPPGVWSMVQPVAPGTLRIGCVIGGVEKSLTVELVDVHGYYHEPGLECPSEEERIEVGDTPGAEPAKSMSTTTNNLFRSRGYPVDDLDVHAPRGYPGQHFSDPTDDPMVQVDRGNDTVAFVHLRRSDDERQASWSATAIDGCRSFLAEATPPWTAATPA